MSVQTFTTAINGRRRCRSRRRGRPPGRRRHRPRRRARAGKSPLPETVVAIHRVAELHGVESLADGGLRLGALASHAEIAASDDVRARFTALADASADRRLARNPRAGHRRWQRDERLARDGDRRRRSSVLGATATLRSPSGTRSVAVEDLWTGPGKTTAAADELLVGVEIPAPAAGNGQRYLRLEYRRQMEIAVVGAVRGGDRRRRRRHGRSGRDDRALPDDPADPRGRGSADRQRRRQRRGRGRRCGRRRGGNPDLRRPRLGRLPARDGGSDRPARDRHGALTRTRGERMKVAATLNGERNLRTRSISTQATNLLARRP